MFGLARWILLPVLLRVPLLRSLLKPFIGHFVRGPWTVMLPLRYLSLETHAFTLGVFTLANWEFAEELFDAYIPQVCYRLRGFSVHSVTALACQSCCCYRRPQRDARVWYHIREHTLPPLCLC